MSTGLSIRVRGGGTLCVPHSASYLSTYVLLEQEDWFEKEIAFVRRLLQPGMRAIDVGANFGCYSIAIGRAVGAGGRLWLYEPTSTTFGYLEATLALNELGWVHAHRVALSDHEGSGVLAVGDNSELNSLGQGARGSASETVALTTLDRARTAHGIDGVDFVKLDAEGEEVRIVAGGREFFREEDPLVMFEVKHGTAVNAELPGAFEALGYRLYRLVGPDLLLVPAAPNGPLEPLDPFELNLFACKAGRAARLAADGYLVEAGAGAGASAGAAAQAAAGSGEGLELWRRQPFAAAFSDAVAVRDLEYGHALDDYARWRDATRSPAVRYAALERSLRALIGLVGRAATLPRLFMLSRVAREAGVRGIAAQMLRKILEAIGGGGHHDVGEPCWPPCERFDALVPGRGLGEWLTASALEALVIGSTFSGYFSGPIALTMLDWLHRCDYASAPMERRRELQGIFSGRQGVVEGSPLLQRAADDNLNPHLWQPGARIARGTA